MMFVGNWAYKLVTRVNAIGSSGFSLKIQYNVDKLGLKKKINDAGKKIYDTSGLIKKQIIMIKSVRLRYY